MLTLTKHVRPTFNLGKTRNKLLKNMKILFTLKGSSADFRQSKQTVLSHPVIFILTLLMDNLKGGHNKCILFASYLMTTLRDPPLDF